MQAITLPALLDSLPQFLDAASEAARECGLDEHAAWEVQLAVDEAVTNIIQHAYKDTDEGVVTLSWLCQDDALVLILRDMGRPFDPEAVAPPDLTSPIEQRKAGGLGLYLMRRLMDNVEFHFDPKEGTTLTMVKRRVLALPEDVRIVSLEGRIDAATTPQLANRIRETIAGGGRKLLLDFSAVSFLSSSGLRTLLILARELKAQNGEIHLCALSPQVAQVFDLTGFDRLFPIHQTREEALAALRSSQEIS